MTIPSVARGLGTVLLLSTSGLFAQESTVADTVDPDLPVVTSFAFRNALEVFVSSEGGVYRSTNNGDSWALFTNSVTMGSCTGISFNSKGHVFISSDGNGVFRSTDQGNTWERRDTTFKYHQVGSLAINSRDQIFIGDGVNPFVFRSDDDGVHWSYEPATRDYQYGDITIDSKDQLFVYTSAGLLTSTNNGEGWFSFGTRGMYACNLAVDSLGKAFIGGEYDWVTITTDLGKTWVSARPSKDSLAAVSGLAIAPEGLIFAAFNSGLVTVSLDGGIHWVDTSIRSYNTYPIVRIAINPFAHVFVSTKGGGLLRSTDKGKSWRRINRGFVPLERNE